MYSSNFSVAVLAGGQSRRFGGDKTLAMLNGKTLTSVLCDKFRNITDDIMVISKNPNKFSDVENVRLIDDAYKDQCPLVGIITSLMNSVHEKVFIVSADTPFVRSDLPVYMSGIKGDVILPKIKDKLHTLCGIYSKNTLSIFDESYKNGIFTIFFILEQLKTAFLFENEIKRLDPELISFFNINTKEEFRYAEKYIIEKGL